MKHALVPSLSLLCLSLGLLLGHARAQGSSKRPGPETGQAPSTPAPNAADVGSIDGIIAALYEAISGPAGQRRDWERLRALFAPGARLMPTFPVLPPGTKPDAPLTGDETYATQILDVDAYVERAGKYFEQNGFFERETARRVESFGHIAHVWSTYESRHRAEDPKPFSRGINSIQLMHDGRRWWVVSIFWEAESPRAPIPKKYLKGGR